LFNAACSFSNIKEIQLHLRNVTDEVPSVMVHTCNPSTQKTESRGLQVQGWSGLQSEFKMNLGYTGRPCLKKTKTKPKPNQNVTMSWMMY
jgi:hypothetical protein